MAAHWRPAYVAIGSNLDHPRERVLEAMQRLNSLTGTSSVRRSRLYASRPMGPVNQPQFVNAAAGLLTQLTAPELLAALFSIERSMGRVRQERWGPRIIDLDLVWMVDSAMSSPGLSVPHPGVSTRNFVLYPLADIAPTLEIAEIGNVLALMRAAGDDGITVLE